MQIRIDGTLYGLLPTSFTWFEIMVARAINIRLLLGDGSTRLHPLFTAYNLLCFPKYALMVQLHLFTFREQVRLITPCSRNS